MRAELKAKIEAQLKKAAASEEKKHQAEIERAKKTMPCHTCTERESCTDGMKLKCGRLSKWIEKQVYYKRPAGSGLEVVCNPMPRDERERQQEGHDRESELEYLFYKNRVLTGGALSNFIGCETQQSTSREQLLALCKRQQIPPKYRPTLAQWQCLTQKVKHGWTNRQLAEHLKISEQAAGKNINQAIKKLEAYTNMTGVKEARKVFYNTFRSTFPNPDSLFHWFYKQRGFWINRGRASAKDADEEPEVVLNENDE